MKKVGMIVLALVIALGALGAGYAYWTQDLHINGSVATGNMSVIFTGGSGTVVEPATSALTTVSASGKTATVTVTNAYPGYAFQVILNGTNNGTIPVKLLNATYTPVSGTIFDKMTIGDVYITAVGIARHDVTPSDINTTLPVGAFTLEFNFSFDTTMTGYQSAGPTTFNLDMNLTQFNDPASPSF
jgi:predicted ribosomally synthesized peptide with SipW-like signal peptide